MKSTIRLTIDTPWGRFAEAVSMDEDIFRERLTEIDAPTPDPFIMRLEGHTFESVVSLMRRREFRKDLLREEALRLATQIAERLEDREGWHGEDRRKTAKRIAPCV